MLQYCTCCRTLSTFLFPFWLTAPVVHSPVWLSMYQFWEKEKMAKCITFPSGEEKKSAICSFDHQNKGNNNKKYLLPSIPRIILTLYPVLCILQGLPLNCSVNSNPFRKLLSLAQPCTGPHRPGPESSRWPSQLWIHVLCPLQQRVHQVSYFV